MIYRYLNKLIFLTLSVSLISYASAFAATYTNRAAFDAALGGNVTCIDFEGIAVGPGQAGAVNLVGNEFSGLGVTLTAGAGATGLFVGIPDPSLSTNNFVNFWASDFFPTSGSAVFSPDISTLPAGTIRVDFATPQDGVGVYFLDAESAGASIEAFDGPGGTGNSLGRLTLRNQGDNSQSFAGIVASGIQSAVLIMGGAGDGVGLDDLCFGILGGPLPPPNCEPPSSIGDAFTGRTAFDQRLGGNVTSIDFEGIATGPGQAGAVNLVGNEFSGLGVTLTAGAGATGLFVGIPAPGLSTNNLVNFWASDFFPTSGSAVFSPDISTLPAGTIRVDFAIPQDGVGVYFLDAESAGASIEAFDGPGGTGNSLGRLTLRNQGDNSQSFAGIVASGIQSAVLVMGGVGDGVGLDDLCFGIWQAPPDCNPLVEDCFDNVDNDADGLVDCADSDCSGATDGACNTGNLGICADGTLTCVDGTEQCVQNNQEEPENCSDGLDNDCDGFTDGDDLDCQVNSVVSVPVDIKPPSCPNPINIKNKETINVAIVGTANFNVGNVDTGSVALAGVAPIPSSFALKDVATPFEPFIGKEDALDCNSNGPDGILDLTMRFDTQRVLVAIDDSLGRPVVDREVVAVTLTGNLLDGTPIVGEDVIVILRK